MQLQSSLNFKFQIFKSFQQRFNVKHVKCNWHQHQSHYKSLQRVVKAEIKPEISRELRTYQREAVDALKQEVNNIKGGKNRLLVVVPTGGGKSVIIAKFVEEIYKAKGWEIIVSIDVQELVQQNTYALNEWWKEDPIEIGVCCASLNKQSFDEKIFIGSMKERSTEKNIQKFGLQKTCCFELNSNSYDKKVVVGSIQTMSSKKSLLNFGTRQILIVDEAHKIIREGQGRYGKFIQQLTQENPDLIIIGFTATPFRTDSGLLIKPYKGQRPIFDKIVYSVSIQDLINNNYLTPLSIPAIRNKLDLKGVPTLLGDFKIDQLDQRVNQDKYNQKIVSEIIQRGQKLKRRSWLIFACSIKHAQNLKALLVAGGISTEIIVGDKKVTSEEDRLRIIDKFRNFEIQAVVNVNVLTTGFDHPGLDLIAQVRPTKSLVLHVQMLGRGLRNFDGKEVCTVLDFGGNCERLGSIEQIDGEKKSSNKHIIIDQTRKIDTRASLEGNLTFHPAFNKLFAVEGYKIFKYTSKSGNDCLKIEWILLGERFPVDEYFTMKEGKKLLQKWWTDHQGKSPSPKNKHDAFKRQEEIMPFLNSVKWIEVSIGRWKNVVSKMDSHGIKIWQSLDKLNANLLSTSVYEQKNVDRSKV